MPVAAVVFSQSMRTSPELLNHMRKEFSTCAHTLKTCRKLSNLSERPHQAQTAQRATAHNHKVAAYWASSLITSSGTGVTYTNTAPGAKAGEVSKLLSGCNCQDPSSSRGWRE